MSIDIKNFLEDCRSRGLTKQTTATYKSNITTYLNFVGNPLNVDTSILCKFLDYLKVMEYRKGKVTKKGIHPSTIKTYFSAISTYYDYLVFIRQLDINPILQFTRRYLSRIKQQYNGDNSRQLITIEQMSRLVSLNMPILDRAILMILAKTGVRRGELIAMDLKDINLDKKEIILKPKAKRTNRLVFFDDETTLVLRAYLEWRNKKTKSKALFVSSYDSERISRNRVNEIVARHGSALDLHDPEGNLNTKLTPHCFRHWFTTHLRRSGLPREFIQELRGDRRKDAIDIYDHIDLSELKDRYSECIPKLLEIPKERVIVIPGQGVKVRPDQGVKVKPGQGVTVSPDQGVKVKPGQGLKVRPGQRVTVSPDQGVKVKPGQGVTVSPDQGVKVKPGQGLKVRPGQGVTVSPDQGVKVKPGQGLKVRPGQGVTVSPDQGVKVKPGQGLKVRPGQGVKVKQDHRGKHRHAIYGFTLTLYEYIKRHEGLSTSTISKYFLKNKGYVKQYLYNLKNYGLIINDRGNWYPISKEPIAEPHLINSTEQSKAVLVEA